MFRKKTKKNNESDHSESQSKDQTALTIDALRYQLENMADAECIERHTLNHKKVTLIYIRTLINQERLNEAIIEPLNRYSTDSIDNSLSTSKISKVTTLEMAKEQLMQGSILLYDVIQNHWFSVQLENPLSRGIQQSVTETVIYGAKDSFTEQLESNITMLRRRLPLTTLKMEKFTVGHLSKTSVVLFYIEGLTNPDLVAIARDKISKLDFDQFLESSQLAAFMEDHHHSVFPQFLQTDRPDAAAFALGEGKIAILMNNSPFAILAPITFFHLFQSPEDYFLRWPVASFLRLIRYTSYFLSLALIPLYVALSTHHYQMVPLQVLFVLLESRSKLPFTPFWEAFLMLVTLEIIREASLRMPTKTSQTLGVIGGIVIGQAAVEAGFASKILIVLMGISAIASFLVPNYQMTKTTTLVQFTLLLLSSFMGILGVVLGMIVVLVHLNGLSSLKQPYFAPVTPFYWKGWLDLFIRGPLIWMKTRPENLNPLQKWRMTRRR